MCPLNSVTSLSPCTDSRLVACVVQGVSFGCDAGVQHLLSSRPGKSGRQHHDSQAQQHCSGPCPAYPNTRLGQQETYRDRCTCATDTTTQQHLYAGVHICGSHNISLCSSLPAAPATCDTYRVCPPTPGLSAQRSCTGVWSCVHPSRLAGSNTLPCTHS